MHLSPFFFFFFFNKRPECFQLSSQKNASEINLSFSLPFSFFCRQKEAKPIPSPSTSALQLLGKTSPTLRAWGIPRAAAGLLSHPGSAAEGAPRRGRLSLETRCQQRGELAENVGGSLQMPRKSPCWVTFRLEGPWDNQGSGLAASG